MKPSSGFVCIASVGVRGYFAPMDTPPRPEDLVGQPAPDLSLTDTNGTPFRLHQYMGRCPLVLFFIIRSGTPG